MKLCDLNPHIRFASRIHYVSDNRTVKVSDCRIFYVTAGEAALQINGQTYQLLPDSLFFCCGGSTYTIAAPKGFDPICLNFDLTQDYNTYTLPYPPRIQNWESMAVNFAEVEDSKFLSNHLFIADAKELFPIIDKITSIFTEKAPYYLEYSSCSLKKLLLLLHKDASSANPPKIQAVKDYIDHHYACDISNKDLAAIVGYHEYHLNRLFLACTGIHLHKYLLQVRLKKASYLILNTDLPLKAIPEQTGFHSYPHFSSYFKQHFGVSPAQYRMQFQHGI